MSFQLPSLIQRMVYLSTIAALIGLPQFSASLVYADEARILSFEEILAKYQSHLSKRKFLSFQYQENNEYREEKASVTLSKDGTHLISNIKMLRPSNEYYVEILRTTEQFINIQKQNNSEYSVFSMNDISVAEASPHAENSFSLLVGYVPLGTWKRIGYLPAILSETSFELMKRNGDEPYCFVGISGDCEVTICFDPKFDYTLSKCTIKRITKTKLQEGDLPLFASSFKDFKLYDGMWLPLSFECVFSSTASKPADDESDKRVLYSGTTKHFWTLNQYQISDSASRSDFRLNASIHDYTPVYVMDAPQIDYVWLDGKVVPLTDELALARIRGHSFKPGIRNPRTWLIAAGLIMILLAGGLKIREFMQKRKGGE